MDASFQTIFESEFSYVCRSLRRCGVPDRDVEDLAHDVFLTAHVRFADFDRARAVKPWLFGIVFRVASHHRRRPGYRREELGEPVEHRDAAPLADEQLELSQRRAVVLEALESLDLERRAVFILHDLDELPMREIAASLGIPLFTAYSRLRAARTQFADAVRKIRLRRGEK